MIITGTSVAGAQEHPQFTADQTEIRLAKEELQTVQLSIEEYLKECWKNKQEVIDVSAYKLNEEELNKVIFGIHYENPEYYWVLRNTAINKDEETGFVKNVLSILRGNDGKNLLTGAKNWNGNGSCKGKNRNIVKNGYRKSAGST